MLCVQHFDGGVGQIYFTKGIELKPIISALKYSMLYLKRQNQTSEKVTQQYKPADK